MFLGYFVIDCGHVLSLYLKLLQFLLQRIQCASVFDLPILHHNDLVALGKIDHLVGSHHYGFFSLQRQ